MQYESETIEMYAAGWGGGSNSIMSWWRGGGGNAWELERGPKTWDIGMRWGGGGYQEGDEAKDS
jgi:hypothetical protein